MTNDDIKRADDDYRKKFDVSHLDTFFGDAVWREILLLVGIRKANAIRTLSSTTSTREEDLIAKGELNHANFITNIREILSGDLGDEQTGD